MHLIFLFMFTSTILEIHNSNTVSQQNDDALNNNGNEILVGSEKNESRLDISEDSSALQNTDPEAPYEPVRGTRASHHREGSLWQERRNSCASTNAGRISMNIQSSSFSLGDHEGKYDDEDESISTLDSDIKSLESIKKNDDFDDVNTDTEGLKEIKKSSEEKLSDMLTKDDDVLSMSASRMSSVFPPSIASSAFPPSIASSAASAITRKSGCSKKNIMKHPSPKVLLISLCSISALSIGVYLLLHFSVLPFDMSFEGANIYNNFYSATAKQPKNNNLAMNNLKF